MTPFFVQRQDTMPCPGVFREMAHYAHWNPTLQGVWVGLMIGLMLGLVVGMLVWRRKGTINQGDGFVA
jgi:hypothetical protein